MSYPSYSQQNYPNPQHSGYAQQNAPYPTQNIGYVPQPGYPPASGYSQQAAYPPASGYPGQQGYPQQGAAYLGPGANSQQQPAFNPAFAPPTQPPPTSSQNMEEMHIEGDEFAFSDKSIRRAFIRKVYIILTVQLAITFGIVAIFTYVDDVKHYVAETPEIYWTSFVLFFATFIVLGCVPNFRRKTPWNFIFLFIFTVVEGVMLGCVTSLLDSDDVAKAMIATIVIVLGLTLFSFQTKLDLTILVGVLVSLSFALIMFGFMALIWNSELLYNMYACLGAFLFSVYIVVDTQLLLGGKHKLTVSPEEYIFCALNLYLDIINLFTFLLMIFARN